MGESSLVASALGRNEGNRPVATMEITLEERRKLSEVAGAKVDIEWVVDVADNNLNWFIATAYKYDDSSRTIDVAIPDRREPEWEGSLPLDHRLVHFIECCDGKTDALYKFIIAKATVEVKWRVEWKTDEWKRGIATYYGRLSNTIFVRPDKFPQKTIEVGVDENLRLLEVLTGARDDFDQLLADGVVQGPSSSSSGEEKKKNSMMDDPSTCLQSQLETLERLAEDMAHCTSEALRMRCVSEVEHQEAADRLKQFIAGGDLDAFDKIKDDAEKEAMQNVAKRRQDAQDDTLEFVSKCETKFWNAVSSGLFFRRQYALGDEVDVVLCKGLETRQGTVSFVHDNDTYDIDLDDGDDSEVGVNIPPEYLRPRNIHRTGFPPEDRSTLLTNIAALYKERQRLRDDLDALTKLHHKEEVPPPPQKTPKTKKEPTPKQESRQCWMGSLACGCQKFDHQLAKAVLPEDGTVFARERCDVVAIALQDTTSSAKDVVGILKKMLGLKEEDDWRDATSSTTAALMVVLARATATSDLWPLSSATDHSTVGVKLALRGGETVAFLSAKIDPTQGTMEQHNEKVAAHLSEVHFDEQIGGSSSEQKKNPDHVVFIGDLGYGFSSEETDEVRSLIKVSDWTTLATHDSLMSEKEAHHVFSGWETVTPRFPPTSFLRGFDGSEELPCWRERLLWKSLPGVRDDLKLELFDKRETPLRRDAVVGAFSLRRRNVPLGSHVVGDAVAVTALETAVLRDAVDDDKTNADVVVSGSWLAYPSEAVRTTSTNLAPKGPSQLTASWSDDDDDDIRLPCQSRVTTTDHVFVDVFADGAFLGGCALSLAILLENAADDDSVDIEEPLVRAGVLTGFIYARITFVNRSSTPGTSPPSMPTPDTKPTKRSLKKSVTRSLKSIFSRAAASSTSTPRASSSSSSSKKK